MLCSCRGDKNHATSALALAFPLATLLLRSRPAARTHVTSTCGRDARVVSALRYGKRVVAARQLLQWVADTDDHCDAALSMLLYNILPPIPTCDVERSVLRGLGRGDSHCGFGPQAPHGYTTARSHTCMRRDNSPLPGLRPLGSSHMPSVTTQGDTATHQYIWLVPVPPTHADTRIVDSP